MKIRNSKCLSMVAWLLISSFTLMLTACSSDKDKEATKETSTAALTATKTPEPDQEIEGEASESVKEKFEKRFTEACVKRELKSAVNPDIEEKRAEENCSCIAEHMADDLTDVDAEKYIEDGVDTRTLQIKFDTATFFCLQNKKQFKGPQIFGRQ